MDLYGSVPCDLPLEVVRDALALSVGSRNFASFSEDNVAEWVPFMQDRPLISVGSSLVSYSLETPLAVEFSVLHNSIESFALEDVWDGENVNTGNVSKWAASQLKSTAACIVVAFSGYEYSTSFKD